MTERDLIVRCPGCGNGKVIALAVGQLLQCDICRTAFHAPVNEPGGEGGAAETDSFVVGLPPPPPTASGTQHPTAPNRSPADSSPAGSASRANTTKTRVWRTDDLDVATQKSPTPESESPDNPPGPLTTVLPPPADADDEQEDEELVLLEPRGRIWAVISIVAGSVIAVTFVLGGLYLFHRLATSGPSTTDVAKPKIKSSATNSSPGHWTDASKSSQRRDPITVKIERVRYGSVRVRDVQNQVITTEDENLLAITISVHNRGQRARGFQNWYGHAFAVEDGVEVIAELSDDQQRSYSLLKFDDVSQIEGQRLADQIDSKQTVQDTLVFLIPKNIDRGAIRFFRLTLPGAAVGMKDFFRFQIPASMIEGFGETPVAE